MAYELIIYIYIHIYCKRGRQAIKKRSVFFLFFFFFLSATSVKTRLFIFSFSFLVSCEESIVTFVNKNSIPCLLPSILLPYTTHLHRLALDSPNLSFYRICYCFPRNFLLNLRKDLLDRYVSGLIWQFNERLIMLSVSLAKHMLRYALKETLNNTSGNIVPPIIIISFT